MSLNGLFAVHVLAAMSWLALAALLGSSGRRRAAFTGIQGAVSLVALGTGGMLMRSEQLTTGGLEGRFILAGAILALVAFLTFILFEAYPIVIAPWARGPTATGAERRMAISRRFVVGILALSVVIMAAAHRV